MDAAHFELNMTVPCDERFAATVRGLAVHAAQYAGCGQAAAEQFGADVEREVHACIGRTVDGALVAVVLRRQAGPVEVRIGSRTVSVDV